MDLKISSFFLCLGLGIWLTTPVHATIVRQVSMDEMLRHSQLVFEGIVTDKQVLTTPHGRPYTEVTFRIIEIIKGQWPKENIRLSFLGGELPGKKLRIQEMVYPQPGEHGIYFVETTEKPQVNPLYGWSQGRFMVIRDDTGNERVVTADGLPVIGLHFGPGSGEGRPNRGIAKGVRIERQEQGAESMSLSDFKVRLRQRVWELDR